MQSARVPGRILRVEQPTEEPRDRVDAPIGLVAVVVATQRPADELLPVVLAEVVSTLPESQLCASHSCLA